MNLATEGQIGIQVSHRLAKISIDKAFGFNAGIFNRGG
jgi:hypothetical protein